MNGRRYLIGLAGILVGSRRTSRRRSSVVGMLIASLLVVVGVQATLRLRHLLFACRVSA